MLNQLLNREPSGHSAPSETSQLHEWAPLRNLPKRYQDEILNRSSVKEYAAGDIIFMIRDDDENDYYLLEGSVELINESRERIELHKHSGQKSLELIDHNRPRIFTARAKQNSKIFLTRRTFFDTLNSSSGGKQAIPEVEVDEIDMEGSGNWMVHLLNSSVFSTLPPESLQQLFIEMDTIKASAGTSIVTQGHLGEHFYQIQSGECIVTLTNENGEKQELERLESGATFGERSLITNQPSDISVEMITDGMLMRISKGNFNALIKNHFVDKVTSHEADALIAQGASWIDIRSSDEYKKYAIQKSINMTIENVYTAIKGLNPNIQYIVCGNSLADAQASAFLLSEKGFTASSLVGSVKSYLDSNTSSAISIEQIAEQETPNPLLETTVDNEDLEFMSEQDAEEEMIGQAPQIEINTTLITESLQNLSKDLENQVRKEINDLFILKQKELELEVTEKFKKYHQVTARLMKKKIDDLERVYQMQDNLNTH